MPWSVISAGFIKLQKAKYHNKKRDQGKGRLRKSSQISLEDGVYMEVYCKSFMEKKFFYLYVTIKTIYLQVKIVMFAQWRRINNRLE